MVVLSAGFVSVMPTCALLATTDCGSDPGPDPSSLCCDVADVAFGLNQDHFVGGDVAVDAFGHPDAAVDADDAADADDADDADDAGRE